MQTCRKHSTLDPVNKALPGSPYPQRHVPHAAMTEVPRLVPKIFSRHSIILSSVDPSKSSLQRQHTLSASALHLTYTKGPCKQKHPHEYPRMHQIILVSPLLQQLALSRQDPPRSVGNQMRPRLCPFLQPELLAPCNCLAYE